MVLNFITNDFSGNDLFIKIFDVSGRVVYEEIIGQEINNNSHSIDVSFLKRGQYLLELKSHQGKIIEKFTKQ